MKPSIAASEYRLLKGLLDATPPQQKRGFESGLTRAAVVDDHALDTKTVRLNSYVEVPDLTLNKIVKVTIVLPAEVNLKQQRISVFSPLSAALLGYREDDQITWKLADRLTDLKILKVVNA